VIVLAKKRYEYIKHLRPHEVLRFVNCSKCMGTHKKTAILVSSPEEIEKTGSLLYECKYCGESRIGGTKTAVSITFSNEEDLKARLIKEGVPFDPSNIKEIP